MVASPLLAFPHHCPLACLVLAMAGFYRFLEGLKVVFCVGSFTVIVCFVFLGLSFS